MLTKRPILCPPVKFTSTNATWEQLRDIFDKIPRIDFAFANAGVSEEIDYFADASDDDGILQEPACAVLDINFRAVVNFVKLAWASMRKNKIPGSIVITTSATAYAPEQSLPAFLPWSIPPPHTSADAGKYMERRWRLRFRPRKDGTGE
ncbi:hypothetical protein F4801DRAFT_600579 [Xylaria longipes]|nr:hypothetical protein F4801DRAFT_600579 [Xylaria longipes]